MRIHYNFLIASLLLYVVFSTINVSAQQRDKLPVKYTDASTLMIEGTAINDSAKSNIYQRLPDSCEIQVREPVWNLSLHSAGLSIRFKTNSTSIHVKWEVLNNTYMNHMSPTGIKGVDLYTFENSDWVFINSGRPQDSISEVEIISNMPAKMREYRLYLPLYDGLKNLKIGIDSSARILSAEKNKNLPIIFYGTSITQGGCASRPGMAHTNILSRKLGIECINFGFSGNGKMENPINQLIAKTPASFYVIECLPNMESSEVNERTIPLVNTIRTENQETPIVFIENFIFSQVPFDENMRKRIRDKNNALRHQYEQMQAEGYKYIYLINSQKALNMEGTVDGVHFTDWGFEQYANFLTEQFNKLGLLSN